MEKVQFASEQWLVLVRRFLTQLVQRDGVPGESFSLCEQYTSAPSGTVGFRDGASAWHFVADGKNVIVAEGALESADVRISVDYETILPIARTVYGDAEVQEQVSGLVVEGPAESAPSYLRELHDLLAKATA